MIYHDKLNVMNYHDNYDLNYHDLSW